MISKINRAVRRQEGFTLVELLVVVGIIGVLAMLLLPQFRQMRERARIASCMSNLKNIGTQLEAWYADVESYPTIDQWNNDLVGTDSSHPLFRLRECPQAPGTGAAASATQTYTYEPGGTVTIPSDPAQYATLNPPSGTLPTRINNYWVRCNIHVGTGASAFPYTVQLWVSEEGTGRRNG
ncbi:MAG: prepilin-type N-terminal cleavage/methylation domain-containing protein [Firmicutes bacterium]|nr:prepilin-type N-terminal cleavage/methylation domain-containing protein [Bacillota bacterium]